MGTLVSYPFDLMRTRLAVQTAPSGQGAYRSLWSGMREVYAAGGIRAFYAGLWPTLVGIAPNAALAFATYEWLRTTVRRHPPSWVAADSVWVSLGVGVLSGIVSKVTTYPLDVIKKRAQVTGFVPWHVTGTHNVGTTSTHPALSGIGGIWTCGRTIVRVEGWRGLFRGLWPTVLKAAPNAGLTFALFDLAQKRIYPWLDHQW